MSYKLVVLGSNSAIPTVNRNPTAHLLNADERFFLIDCAEGTQLQLRKNHIKLQRIEHIFISHLHGDHYFGLIGLLTTMHLLGREKKLTVFSPQGLKEIVEIQLRASNTQLHYPLVFQEVEPKINEIVFEDDKLSVETIPLKHGIPCCGYLFRQKPKQRKIIADVIEQYAIPYAEIVKIKNGADYTFNGNVIANSDITEDPEPPASYAYCSDTAYSEKIISIIQGVDTLYHEATFLEDQKERANKTNHSTAKQAAEIARRAQVGALIVGHYSNRYKEIEPFLEEAKSIFPNTMLAIEGKTYQVTPTFNAKHITQN